MEHRSYDVRSVDTEKREVTGLAVPYDSTAELGGYKERFERGAIADVEDVLLFWNHSEPIGRVVRGQETDGGYEVTAVISKTSRGDEAYTLLRDGVINKFSVGFMPMEDRQDGDVLVRTKVNLKEVSLVPFPAYKGASITEVREQNTNAAPVADTTIKEKEMSNDTTAPGVDELREAVSDLERKVALFSVNEKPAANAVQYRSAGEFLKALAEGKDDAKMQVRAFTGATSADAHADASSWVARTIKLVEENRPVLNLFSKSALPASGNSIEYPVLEGTTGTVGAQVAEGDDLPYMEVRVTTATAPVLTYGGYSSLSRQAIERSDIAYLDTVLRYQAFQYAKVTNQAVRTAVAGVTASGQSLSLGGATGADWLRMVVRARRAIANANSQAAVIVMSDNVYEGLLTLDDTAGRPVFDVNNDGANTFGNLSPANFGGSLAGLPIVLDDAAPSGTLYVAGKDAVTSFENAGAPVRLQDENIINLTKDFSLYGYLAVAVTNPGAVQRVTVNA